MHGRIATFVLVSILALTAFASAHAQPESRRPSLSERLQRFRQDVFGQSEQATRSQQQTATPKQNRPTAANADKKAESGARPTMVTPPPPQPTLATGEMQVPAPSSPQAVNMPERMQMQSARRAQGGKGPVTIITPGAAGTSTMLRPVEEARRRAFADSDAYIAGADEEAIIEAIPVEADELSADYEEQAEAIEDIEVVVESADEASRIEDEPVDEPRSTLQSSSKFSNALRPVAEPESTPEPIVATPVETAMPVASEPNAEPLVAESAEGVLFMAQSPVLSVAAAGPRTVMIGKEAEFFVKVKNSGAPANDVVVKIVVPSYADVASCRGTTGSAQPPSRTEIQAGIEWTIDRLEEGAEETLTLKLIPRKSSPLDLAISYTFTPETSQTMVEVQEPKLAMSLSGPSEVLFGQTKVYKLTISNPGNGDTHNVSVTLLPIGHGSEAPGTHRLGDLLAGESKTIDIELTARQAGAIEIKAQTFADGGLRAEASQEVRVRRAELKVVVEAPHVKYAGTPSTYSLLVENTGDALADGVTLSAILPPDAKFLSASGGRIDPQQARVTWNVGSLPAGGQRTFELQCALNTPGENRLQVAAQATGELNAATTCSTHVEAIADLKLEVRDPQGPVAVGDDAIYEVRIHNRGTKAAQGIDLAVFFSEGLEPSAADGGTHEIGDGQVVFEPLASLAAGEIAVFHVRSRAGQPGNHVFRAEVICESLNTKLAAEEATHFYGDQRVERMAKREPTPAKPRPVEQPVANPYE